MALMRIIGGRGVANMMWYPAGWQGFPGEAAGSASYHVGGGEGVLANMMRVKAQAAQKQPPCVHAYTGRPCKSGARARSPRPLHRARSRCTDQTTSSFRPKPAPKPVPKARPGDRNRYQATSNKRLLVFVFQVRHPNCTRQRRQRHKTADDIPSARCRKDMSAAREGMGF
jgi:hypothetical protein